MKCECPIIRRLEGDASCARFSLLCKSRPHAWPFFHQMLSRWLVPGKRLHAKSHFATDFLSPKQETYLYGELSLEIETPKEFALVEEMFPVLEKELRLGLESEYQAHRIIERKSVESEDKIVCIQDKITALSRRHPELFDHEVFAEMQHFLVLSPKAFKEARSCRQMSRIICTHYLFRKTLRLSNETFPDRRYVNVKLMRATLPNEGVSRRILGIAVGISFLKAHETLEKKHLFNALTVILPDVHPVEGSFFVHVNRSDEVRTYYLEVEKEKKTSFTCDEIQRLKHQLPFEIKNHIEERHSPIFMPQNEEEILRHILTLSHQLKYVQDLPQAVICFQMQTDEQLEFLAIFLRIIKANTRPLAEKVESKRHTFECVHDRTKYVGVIRKHYQKEASVFKVRIPKTPFLRSNGSIDLYKARQKVAQEFSRLLGDFRDFNGGTISKEIETFAQLRQLVGEVAHAPLLEDFFFSITPALMRSVLDPLVLKTLFSLILEAQEMGLPVDQPSLCHIREDSKYLYIVLATRHQGIYEELFSDLEALKISSLTTSLLTSGEFPLFGILCLKQNKEEVLGIRFAVEKALERLEHSLFLLKN